jgi:hypothetical protein
LGTLDKVRESCQGIVGVGTLDILKGKRTTCRITRGNLFILTNKQHAITADSANGHEDAGRGEMCVERRKRKTHFNTLGESGRVAGGSVETL